VRTVLIIDDNPGVGEALALALSLRDIRPLVALGPGQGLALLEREQVDLVIQDMNFSDDTTSGEEGVALFRAIRARHVDVPVVLLTAWTRLESAVELVKAGAADYLAKPWDDARLLATVENLLELAEAGAEVRRVHGERRARKDALAARYELGDLVFEADATLRMLELACQVARADVPVLVTGPNGSGKERVAAIVHANSAVARGPFVAVNCGALPADLIEAELFGAESGAYTGANKAREGRFDAADGGTLFLDEIGNLPPGGQMKLLRVLDTGTFQRLGSNQTRHVKVRVLSATNADLKAMVREGTFREDLFYRLKGVVLRTPALSERPADVPLLASRFLRRVAPRTGFTAGALAWLASREWPGNVRELKAVVESAGALILPDQHEVDADLLRLASGDTSDDASPATGHVDPSAGPLDAALNELELRLVRDAMTAAGGNQSEAARRLGVSRVGLIKKLTRLGLR
jgi:DNA-binding NtrC family response regulator